jgi:amino acid transporter
MSSMLYRALAQIRRALFGAPLPTSAISEERFSNAEALAILSSDALSSVAYATQEIVLVLSLGGAAYLSNTLPITGLIVLLMVVVGISYRQTIQAYPNGGGSYTVSHENLGQLPGLVAGASLAIDYILTVAVSLAAGIDALVSYLPGLDAVRIWLCLAAVLLLMLANLRGVRASAGLLSFPTYLFIAAVMLLIVGGVLLLLKGQLPVLAGEQQAAMIAEAQRSHGHGINATGLLLLMKAFSSGCAALTGIEAISNGVTAFQPTEWRNARKVLSGMVVLLAIMFTGISLLAHHSGIIYVEGGPTLLYQLGLQVFGNTPLLFLLQLGTLLILLLAANTAYADFPRLSALLAKDGYLPRQLASLGDRLVFSNGIIALSGFAFLLLVLTNASVAGLIGLYAVGVFTCFTLSQTGMVVHWAREQGRGWQSKAVVNCIGAAVTAVVTVVLLFSKFNAGAWLIVVLVPLLVALFLTIYNHYKQVSKRLRLAADVKLSLPSGPPPGGGAPVVVLVGQLHRGSYEAVRYARSIATELVAVHVDLGLGKAKAFQEQWNKQLPEVPLVVLESPYRSLVAPVVDFVKQFERQHRKGANRLCTVVLPVFVTRHRWENLLHNQSTYFLRGALRAEGTRVITTVGFYL